MKYLRLKLILLLAVIVCFSITACKPSYQSPLETPDTETMAADEPYDMDFIQINNDIIDYYSDGSMSKIFPFIKNLDVDGSNDPRSVKLILDVAENVSPDAIDILIADITKQIANEAQIQDFRLTKASSDSFGSFFDLYDYSIKVTQGSETLYDETFNTSDGEAIPFDPSVDGETIKESIEAEADVKGSPSQTN